jgi:hypothetical protein
MPTAATFTVEKAATPKFAKKKLYPAEGIHVEPSVVNASA